MPKFSQFLYNTAKYGIPSAQPFSAEPISATVISYTEVWVRYAVPTGEYVGFKIVRNQDQYPLSETDGYVVYLSEGAPDGAVIEDTSDLETAPLVPGKFVYYRAWIQGTSEGDWVPAGTAFTLMPELHTLSLPIDTKYTKTVTPTSDGLVYSDVALDPYLSTTHERFMSLFPKVISTITGSSLDVVNNEYSSRIDASGAKENSLLSTFMSAFSFTVDEILTLAKLTYPDNAGHGAGASTITLRSHELSQTTDVEPVTSTQKKLLRNSVEIYKGKGTVAALTMYAESVTGYDVVVSTSPNLILSHEDATFDIPEWASGEVGLWRAFVGSPVMSVETTQAPALVDTSIDRYYTAKVITGGTNAAIALGSADPVLLGIPVTEGIQYTLSTYVQNSSSANVTLSINWYDRSGGLVSTSSGTGTASAASFTRVSLAAQTAPAKAVYAVPVISFAANATYYIDMVQFEQAASSSTYYEPRAAVLTVDPAPAGGLALYNRITRLSTEVKDYLPVNTPYYIIVENFVEFSDLIRGIA